MKFVTHQTTLHLSFKIKCCVDRLRPPPESGHYSIQAACLKGADIVEKVLSGLRTKFFRAQLGEASEALNRLRESELLLERLAASRILASLAWFYYSLARACLLLGRRDEARHLGDRALEFCSST